MITKQALGSLLFGMADILRDKVEDYKSYILSACFFHLIAGYIVPSLPDLENGYNDGENDRDNKNCHKSLK